MSDRDSQPQPSKAWDPAGPDRRRAPSETEAERRERRQRQRQEWEGTDRRVTQRRTDDRELP